MRVMPPAKTAAVMAMWKQRLSSMCQPFRGMRMVLEEQEAQWALVSSSPALREPRLPLAQVLHLRGCTNSPSLAMERGCSRGCTGTCLHMGKGPGPRTPGAVPLAGQHIPGGSSPENPCPKGPCHWTAIPAHLLLAVGTWGAPPAAHRDTHPSTAPRPPPQAPRRSLTRGGRCR